jgi:hypothetical protein
VDEEAKKAANLGPIDDAHRGRISLEVVKGLIWKQVKERPPKHMRTSEVYSGGFRHLQGTSRREEGSKGRRLRANIVGRKRRFWSMFSRGARTWRAQGERTLCRSCRLSSS